MSDSRSVSVADAGRVLVVGRSRRTAETTVALADEFPGRSLLLASSTTDALDRLERTDVDCVVCDVSDVGDGSPATTLEALASAATQTPIVAIVDGDDATPALEAGATDVISPADPDAVVVTRVRNALERGLIRRQSASESPPDAAGDVETHEDVRRYRSILEHSDVLVFVLDEDGTVRYVNSAIEPATGFTPVEVRRRALSEFVHPEDREDAIEQFASIASTSLGSTRRSTYRLHHADGTWHVYDVTFTNRLGDPTVDGIVLTVTDGSTPAVSGAVSDREASSTHDPASRPPNDPIDRLSYPFVSLDENWVITAANESATQLFEPFPTDSRGRPSERGEQVGSTGGDDPSRALIGTVVWELLAPSASGTCYERFHEARETGSVVEFQTAYPPLETDVEFHVHPDETGVSIYAREASPPSRTDRDRTRLFDAVIDSLEDGVFVLDGRTIEFANATLFDLLGADTLVGRRVDDLFDSSVSDLIVERVNSPIVRRTDPIETTRDALTDRETDRDRTTRPPLAISVVPLPADDRVVCVVRDTTRRARMRTGLSTLREASRSCLSASTRLDVCRTVADACVDSLGSDVGIVFLKDDQWYRPVAVGTPNGASLDPAGLPSLDVEGTAIEGIVEREGTTVTVHRLDDLEGLRTRLGLDGAAEYVLIAPIGTAGVVVAPAHDQIDAQLRAIVDSLVTTAAIALERIDERSTSRANERAVTRTREALDRLEDLDGRHRRIVQILVESDSRSEIERRVCAELAGDDPVSFVWIAEPASGTDGVAPRAVGGESNGYLDELDVVDGRSTEGGEPTARTITTRTQTSVPHIGHEERGLEWSTTALDCGFESVFSVPLVYDEYVYGALSMYADRPSAFDETARTVLADTGTLIAYAINAVETKQALLSDSVVELEFSIDGSVDVLSSLANRTNALIEFDAVVPQSSDRFTIFVRVRDATASTIESVASSLGPVESVRVVRDREDEPLFELVVTEPTLASTVVDHGAVLHAIDATDDQSRVVVELPRDGDVRAFVTVLERKYPGTTLLARRKCDRPARTSDDFRTTIEDRLTDRQLRALEAAYYGGFFEWPRDQTGEEVAASLGVAQPTFNRHFRLAEQKLFTLLFDE